MSTLYRFSFSRFLIELALLCLLCACGSSAAAQPTLPIKTMRVSINGTEQTILTDSHGFALYFYLPDTPTASACTGDCAVTWPPLLGRSSTVSSTASLPGTLTIQSTANGEQVEYNHHLLYTYASDSSLGQVTGNGVNAWYVATPDLTSPTGSL